MNDMIRYYETAFALATLIMEIESFCQSHSR